MAPTHANAFVVGLMTFQLKVRGQKATSETLHRTFVVVDIVVDI